MRVVSSTNSSGVYKFVSHFSRDSASDHGPIPCCFPLCFLLCPISKTLLVFKIGFNQSVPIRYSNSRVPVEYRFSSGASDIAFHRYELSSPCGIVLFLLFAGWTNRYRFGTDIVVFLGFNRIDLFRFRSWILLAICTFRNQPGLVWVIISGFRARLRIVNYK